MAVIAAAALAIDPKDDDLRVDPATGRVGMITGSAEVAQSLTRRLRLWRGEFFWSMADGVPWDRFIGKPSLGEFHLYMLDQIMRDQRVRQVVDFRVAEYDERTRTVRVLFAGFLIDQLVAQYLEVPIGGVRTD